MVHKSRIFVSVAAYRDPQVEKTIRSLYENADYPELIDVGILTQIHTEEDSDCYIHDLSEFPNIRQEIIDFRTSQGACWARSKILVEMYGGQEFTLQIDSHTRFSKQWDTRLKKMWYGLNDPMGVLTHYPMSFDSQKEELYEQHHTRFRANAFFDSKLISVDSVVNGFQDVSAIPRQTFFVAGGFLFGKGEMFQKIPYDPYIYFNGEEITYAARLWTHGYNLYLPTEGFVWHDYHDGGDRKRHWKDLPEEFSRKEILAQQRCRHLLKIEKATDPEAIRELEYYGLGFARTLSDYEHFCGISFRNQTMEDFVKDGLVREELYLV